MRRGPLKSTRRRTALLLAIVLVLLPLAAPPARAGSIPGIRDLPVPVSSLEKLLENRQLVLLHDPAPAMTGSGTRAIRYVTSAAIVDTRPAAVRSAVTNFSSYPEFFPAYQEATVQSSDAPGTAVQFHLSLNMALIEPSLYYTLTFRDHPSGDLTFRRTAGDFRTRRGRWEFLPLPGNRTLLAVTSWIDYAGLGWSVDAILWAQPELERALPVTRAATLVDTIRRRAEESSPAPEPSVVRDTPVIPTVLADTGHHGALATLTEEATPMFIHPGQPLDNNGDTINLIFTSTVDTVEGPIDGARRLLTRFEKVPDFIRQLESVDATRTDTGFVADWQFDLGFSLASIPVSYRVAYRWENQNRLTFRRISGDFQHIYGAYEWARLSEDRTLYAFTSASHIGENAPSLVKLGNLIPNRQIFMGVTLGAIGVENGVTWANDRLNPPDKP